MIPLISTPEQALALVPSTIEEINNLTQQAHALAQQALTAIYTTDDEKRTFTNTLRAFDQASGAFESIRARIYIVTMVHVHESMLTAAHKAALELATAALDYFWYNEKFYKIFTKYKTQVCSQELLSRQEQYYIQKLQEHYERSGLDKPHDTQTRVKEIQKELAQRTLKFSENIAHDKRTVTCTKEELQGISERVLESLSRDADGNYILGTDYPTYFHVMERCSVEGTRRALWIAFHNRAYPENHTELMHIVKLRDEFAQLLGFKSYAHFDIANQMAKLPELVEDFLNNLKNYFEKEAHADHAVLTQELPESVVLTKEGKIKPWDVAYLVAWYKRKYLALDQALLAEYFPLSHVLDTMFVVYQQFFSLRFTEQKNTNSWHKDVQLISVHNDQNQLVGYIFLDLFPRAHKYTHACHVNLVPAATLSTGQKYPGVSVLITNFPKPSSEYPALLSFNDVVTLFHEFGHALHGLLGSTELLFFSGTRVMRDFLEMPSQMLEEWVWQLELIKQLSAHYKTGESLTSDTIETLIQSKHFNSGYTILRQLFLGFLSLEYHKGDTSKELDAIFKRLYTTLLPFIEFSEENHAYASFGHLTGYAAKYYGYLWSEVFALDLFEAIKIGGVLNPELGKKYTREILAKGGSEDPQVLLERFLGRQPTIDAFLRDFGISTE